MSKTCPKCSRQFSDDSKICRTCGAILEEGESPAAPGAPSESRLRDPAAPQPPQPPETDRQDGEAPVHVEVVEELAPEGWTCPNCTERVPAGFLVCWNCGTNIDGTPDPTFVKAPPDGQEGDALEEFLEELREEHHEAARSSVPAARCPQCGSHWVASGVSIRDQSDSFDKSLKAIVYGDPSALVFADAQLFDLAADVCRDCGHVALRALDPQALYRHWRKSRR